jgi:hypothetical protein
MQDPAGSKSEIPSLAVKIYSRPSGGGQTCSSLKYEGRRAMHFFLITAVCHLVLKSWERAAHRNLCTIISRLLNPATGAAGAAPDEQCAAQFRTLPFNQCVNIRVCKHAVCIQRRRFALHSTWMHTCTGVVGCVFLIELQLRRVLAPPLVCVSAHACEGCFCSGIEFFFN